MTEWLQNYWYLALGAVVLGLIVAAWIWLRRPEVDTTKPEIDERPSAGPLEPIKPDIIAAEPMRFDPPPPPPTVELPADPTERPAVPPAVGDPDDLTRIKGLGPKLRTLLTSLGITRFDQIAAWTEADVAEVDRFLGAFQGRITRDNWVEQAGYLARGDTAGFAARFGATGG